jgi:hypothetical protein
MEGRNIVSSNEFSAVIKKMLKRSEWNEISG